MSKKILVVSDSHGNNDNLKKAISNFGPKGKDLEMLIHLGDMQCPLDNIKALVDCPVKAVRGNCDFSSEVPGTDLVMIGGEKAMITHGHRYHCKYNTELMEEIARENGATIVMFGHTHEPMVEGHGGIMVVNPGSISEPRQAGHRPTYLVITLEDDGRKDFVVVTM